MEVPEEINGSVSLQLRNPGLPSHFTLGRGRKETQTEVQTTLPLGGYPVGRA